MRADLCFAEMVICGAGGLRSAVWFGIDSVVGGRVPGAVLGGIGQASVAVVFVGIRSGTDLGNAVHALRAGPPSLT